MQLNLTHLRIGGLVAGILLAGFLFLATDDRPVVQIDFTMFPEFAGYEVVVDGETVGRLEPTGRVHRYGFPVDRGTHRVEVRGPDLAGEPTTVELAHDGEKARLLLDVVSTYEDDRPVDRIVLLR